MDVARDGEEEWSTLCSFIKPKVSASFLVL